MLARLIAVMAGIVLSACVSVPPRDGLYSATSFGAITLLERGDAVVIDVRPTSERQHGIVAGSQWIQFGPDKWTGDVSRKDAQEFVEKIISLGLDKKEVLLLCQEGVRSEAARLELYKNGIQARSVADGYMGNNHGPGWRAWTE